MQALVVREPFPRRNLRHSRPRPPSLRNGAAPKVWCRVMSPRISEERKKQVQRVHWKTKVKQFSPGNHTYGFYLYLWVYRSGDCSKNRRRIYSRAPRRRIYSRILKRIYSRKPQGSEARVRDLPAQIPCGYHRWSSVIVGSFRV